MDDAVDGVLQGEGMQFATSGTTGGGKVVRLSSQALLASARAVNTHLGAAGRDVWVRAIPADHVGGFGILVRARLSGSRVVALDGKWGVGVFVRLIESSGGTLISLVPTQVFDLVREAATCPPSVRAVIVGGGRLDDSLWREARDLGWPVLRSYGMTEAASQIATEAIGGDRMRLLGDWEIRSGSGGLAEIRGSALFDGYEGGDGSEILDGWFRTSDRVTLGEDADGLFVCEVRREGRLVKVLGELVDLDVVEREVGAGVVVAVGDDRAGMRLVLVCEESGVEIESYNRQAAGPARISEVVRVAKIPRTELGKPRYGELADAVG